MYVLITYDVNISSDNGSKRLRQVAKVCQDYGRRVQNSVFECKIEEADLVKLESKIKSIIDTDVDSIRIYRLGKSPQYHIKRIGKETTYDIDDALII